MKQYIHNLKQKTPHEQRGHAVRLAVVATAIIFFVWITAVGVRLSLSATGPTPDVSSAGETLNTANSSQSQLASVVSSIPNLISGFVSGGGNVRSGTGNQLEVATTSAQGASLVGSQ